MSKSLTRRVTGTLAATAALALLAGCATTNDSGGNDGSASSDSTATDSGSDGGSTSGGALVVGTTDKVTLLDPAGSYDNGSFMVMNQIYPFLVNTMPGTENPMPEPDIAVSAEFTAPTEYTVVIKEGLTFANGNELTASDVAFTFQRQVDIADANGPSYLLANMESVEAVDDTTVRFTLKSENDQTFAQILASPAAPIVDEEVFPADALLTNQEIIDAQPFAGQYTIDAFTDNELINFVKFDGYQGMLGAAATDTVTMRYYADATNMRLDVEQGNIDVAYRSLAPNDVAALAQNSAVTVHEGPGGEIRYVVFNLDTMPFGAAQPDADAAKALAVRQAIAATVDREAIASEIYQDTYQPLYGYVPEGLAAAGTPLMDLYGDGAGGPDVAQATQILADAGVATPVNLALQYSPDHYGPSSGDEYAMVKAQLEATGLFTVDLQSTEWVQYAMDRTTDVYPLHQLGWFPDYSDADNYLTPFFSIDNFLVNHYANQDVQDLITAQLVETDSAAREQMLVQIQELVAQDLPTLPLLQGKQIAVAGADVKGVELDGSFKFRFGTLSK